MRGIDTLRRHAVAFNTLTTVHRRNGDSPVDVYRFLREVDGGLIQFIPIVERIGLQSPGEWPHADCTVFQPGGTGRSLVG